MSDSDSDEFEATLSEALTAEFDVDRDEAVDAAAKAAAFRADFDEDLTPDHVLDAFSDAPYDGFSHRFDFAIGHLAAQTDACTDSREYRIAGFGTLAADPTQGA